jgi:hypothetical protein
MRRMVFGVVAALAMVVPALGSAPAYAATTPPGEDNPYRLTIPTSGGCEDSEGRSAGQYAEECYPPYSAR